MTTDPASWSWIHATRLPASRNPVARRLYDPLRMAVRRWRHHRTRSAARPPGTPAAVQQPRGIPLPHQHAGPRSTLCQNCTAPQALGQE
ncbi:hypothetical protein [Kitasatospora sp. NPDC059160]|uniref:hypothetical protein n=1 Tax=Kitasatospora sp. NPDC059160 TaxID=3346748 RepID=UPI0036907651